MDGLGFIHFKQVHPLPASTAGYLKKADRTILIENNATSQFGKLLRLEAGLEVDETILKWDGLAFSVEGITRDLKRALERRR